MSNWKKKTLGEILLLIRNGCSSKQTLEITSFPVTRIETISENKIEFSKVGYVLNINESYRLKDGDILLSNINSVSHIGKVAYYEEKDTLYHGMNLLLLRFKEDYDQKFTFYYLTLYKKWFEIMSCQAINQASINQATIKNFEIVVPDSKAEQHKISEILTQIDQAIQQTEALIAKHQRIKTGLMQDLLTKGIDENGNMRSEETHKFKDSILGRIPKEWEVKELGYCAAIIDPQPDHRTPPAVKEGIPYLGISDFLDNGDINTQSVRLVSPDVYIKQKNSFEISAGDILFGKIGTIGMPKLLPINIKYALSANSILIKPYKNPSFIYWALLSPATENQIQTEIHSTTQPAFGIQKLRKLKIPFPQKQEQFVIETIFNTFQKATSLEVSLLNKYKSIKTGLMQNLLTGKVSVEPLLDSKN